MARRSLRLVLARAVVLTTLACACGSSERRSLDRPKPTLVPMPESRALELIDGWLTESAWIGRPGWVVAISDRAHLEVDLRLGNSNFGIEWVSDEDRDRYGSALPPPAPEGQLRLFHSKDGAQVLILDQEVYRSPRERTLDRSMVLSDAEMRLRRDLMDFIAYVERQ